MAAQKGNGRSAGHVAPAKDQTNNAPNFIADAIELELAILFLIRCDKKHGKTISQIDRERGRIARQRIRAAGRLAMSNLTQKKPCKGRGKAKASLKLIDASISILKAIQPCSVRAVCYQLFMLKLIRNMGKNSTGAVGKQLVHARENGLIPWPWIVDETRAPETISSWDSPESIIEVAVNNYRKDYWAMQPVRVEVWAEKGTIRGTVAPILKKYGVTFRVMHGYVSATSIKSIADETVSSDKPMTVFYIGDHDPSGRHMSEIDLPNRLSRYGGNATLIRLALDDRDIQADSQLPWFPAADKTTDIRYQWFTERFGQRCWEVDALSPPVLRDRLEHAIVGELDIDAWNHAVRIEQAEVDSMRSILGNWKRTISSPAAKYPPAGGADHE